MKTSNGTINNGALVAAMLVSLAGCTGEYAEQYMSVDAAEPDSNATTFSESLKDEAFIDQAYFSEEEGLGYDYAFSTLPAKGQRDCLWGSSDCNRCVHNVAAQLDALSTRFTGPIEFQYEGRQIDGPGLSDSYEHVQSIGRLPNLGSDEYMVITYSTASDSLEVFAEIEVVRMGANKDSDGYAFGDMSDGAGIDPNTHNRNVSATSTKNNHPGGLSVMGSYVYVAQWCQPENNEDGWFYDDLWCDQLAEEDHGRGFSVYDLRHVADSTAINSNPPEDVGYRHVANDSWFGNSSTAAIAATKLANGDFLWALSRTGGAAYGFYSSESPLGPYDFVNSTTPAGANGENANFLTECETGDLYMVEMKGVSVRSSLVVVDSVTGHYSLSYVATHNFDCNEPPPLANVAGREWCEPDKGAGFHITPSGDLILYATRGDTDGGYLRMAEFTGLNTPYVLPVPIMMAIL